MNNFKKYIQSVREQLDCNASDEYKKQFVVYMYSNEEVDNNLEYFKSCMKNNLSPYKALLFFGDHLEGNEE